MVAYRSIWWLLCPRGGGITSQVPPMEKKNLTFLLPFPRKEKGNVFFSFFYMYKQQKYLLILRNSFSSSFFADPNLTNMKKNPARGEKSSSCQATHHFSTKKYLKKTRIFFKKKEKLARNCSGQNISPRMFFRR